MIKLSIMGAGELGTTLAQKIAAADLPAEVLLLDPEKDTAQGKALDLLQSNPILASGVRITGSDDFSALDDSDYVVVADFGSSASEAPESQAVEALCSALRSMRRKPVVLLAQTHPVRLMHRIIVSSQLPPSRILGAAPVALASTWRRHYGRFLRCSPQDVQVCLLGAPPEAGLYEVFSSVGGRSLADLLSVTELRKVAHEVSGRDEPGPRNVASAVSTLLKDMLRKEGTVQSCYAWMKESYDARRVFACAPIVLEAEGVRRVLELQLNPAERVTMDRALDYLARLQPS